MQILIINFFNYYFLKYLIFLSCVKQKYIFCDSFVEVKKKKNCKKEKKKNVNLYNTWIGCTGCTGCIGCTGCTGCIVA